MRIPIFANGLIYYEEHMSTYFYANTGKTE